MGKDENVNSEKLEMVNVDLNDIEADIETIYRLISKYGTYEYNRDNYKGGDVRGAINNGEIKVCFPVGVKLKDIIDQLEHLGCLADEFSNGFYCILEEARREVNKINGSYNGFYESQELLEQELKEKCITEGGILKAGKT